MELKVDETKNWFESVNLAIEGILYAAKTQRHMRYHFWVAAAILIFSLFLSITKLEFLILAFAILFVLFAEMINTAIEATVDLLSPSYSKLAKIAKDTAAGAVLIASIGAVVTGYLVLYPHLREPFTKGIEFAKNSPEHITFIALVIVIIAVIMSKAYSKKGGRYTAVCRAVTQQLHCHLDRCYTYYTKRPNCNTDIYPCRGNKPQPHCIGRAYDV